MILVTGGVGYIGSHVCAALVAAGYDVVIADSLVNSHRSAVDRIGQIAGRRIAFIQCDMRDADALACLFKSYPIDSVIHLAGLKSVADSATDPLGYWDANVVGSLRLVEAMARAAVHRLVFSSSATVYGTPLRLPVTEDHPCAPLNPYGRTKLVVEELLRDLEHADPRWTIATLRYFNPVGAHDSGLIGESPSGAPGNLMPFVAQVAAGRRSHVVVHGDDYDTPDGSGVRDYVHVVDLADAHVRAVAHLAKGPGFTVNLGTGRGASVFEILAAFAAASGRPIARVLGPRRPGDVAISYADPSRAQALLGWRASRDLATMCADHWRWQNANPDGYSGV